MEKILKREKQNELVLVFDYDLMYGFEGLLPENYPEMLYIDGISTLHDDFVWLREVISRAYYMPRGIVEEDPKYKQLIPYIVIQNKGKIFTYQREGAESRLTGKFSIGIGGHVNLVDRIGGVDHAVEKAAKREIQEELDFKYFDYATQLQLNYNLCRPDGLIYAGRNSDLVNAVHFGVVYLIRTHLDDLEDNMFLIDEGKQLDWMTKEELIENKDQLELWSRMVVEECL